MGKNTANELDPLAPGDLRGYNVYRHCAKLRELWLSEQTRATTAEAQLKAAREALEPFAARCDEAVRPDDSDRDGVTVKTGYLRAARAALNPKAPS